MAKARTREVTTLDADFAAFVERVEERGPSIREFQAALGLSSSSVAAYHLMRLEREGLIERSGPTGQHAENRPYRLTAKGRALAGKAPAVEYALPESGGGW